ncbi:MAG: GNAT family N-acetyltransferase [Terriglobales bacterium]
MRPVKVEDASFIVSLRTDPVLNRFVHEVSPRVEDQVAWIESYFKRSGDYYFVVEDANTAEPHGTIGLYDVSLESRSAEWGRWILRRGSMAALESAWLIYEAGFSTLRLDTLCSRTLAENAAVVSFHDSFGACRGAVLERHFVVRGNAKSAVEHRIQSAEWPSLRARHYANISRLAARAS